MKYAIFTVLVIFGVVDATASSLFNHRISPGRSNHIAWHLALEPLDVENRERP